MQTAEVTKREELPTEKERGDLSRRRRALEKTNTKFQMSNQLLGVN